MSLTNNPAIDARTQGPNETPKQLRGSGLQTGSSEASPEFGTGATLMDGDPVSAHSKTSQASNQNFNH